VTCNYWSDDEIAILRDIMSTGKSLKKNMHRLPGRTHFGASTKCTEMQIKRHTMEMRILAAMADGKARTAEALAVEIAVTRKHVASMLFALSVPGDDQSVHVVSASETRRRVPVYVVGKGENRLWFVPKAHQRDVAQSEAAKDKKYRAEARWWPHADLVVVASINAMVHAGRAPA
jgi:hypothetical protein